MVSRVNTAVERSDISVLVVLSVDALLLLLSVTSDWRPGAGNKVWAVLAKVTVGDTLEDELKISGKL